MRETGNKHASWSELDPTELNRAAKLLASGGVVAFPTETWYGLAVDPFDPQALSRLFAVKARPPEKPVLVLIGSHRDLDLLVSGIPEPYFALMEQFWPGPLTLVFPARKELPRQLTAGSETIAIRYSPHPVAQALVTCYGRPITATSANRSGQPACASAAEVRAALGPSLDLILDGGATPGGAGSTIVRYGHGRLKCLRDGQLDFDRILAVERQHLQRLQGETMNELMWSREFTLKQMDGDAQLLDELLVLFCDASDKDFATLCEAAEAEDAAGVVAAAHSIKGAAAALGIEGIRQLALEIELQAREGDVGLALREKDRLGRLLQACRQL